MQISTINEKVALWWISQHTGYFLENTTAMMLQEHPSHFSQPFLRWSRITSALRTLKGAGETGSWRSDIMHTTWPELKYVTPANEKQQGNQHQPQTPTNSSQQLSDINSSYPIFIILLILLVEYPSETGVKSDTLKNGIISYIKMTNSNVHYH